MRIRALTGLTTLALLVGGCSLVGQEDDGKGAVKSTEVTLVTHESFVLPDEPGHEVREGHRLPPQDQQAWATPGR
ncbi:hypothetical protein G5V59_14825 [Nocardioides sp. W3-2-3]|uniref:hypothetical protein n=1 Tax=Nocardioides convexus TaxID=2712224 RepID=UPI0024183E5E|nr:hypothetical protein [Nocardioides convexus]NHA00795.1 hypothetical protein [Nocardioides convexus]